MPLYPLWQKTLIFFFLICLSEMLVPLSVIYNYISVLCKHIVSCITTVKKGRKTWGFLQSFYIALPNVVT